MAKYFYHSDYLADDENLRALRYTLSSPEERDLSRPQRQAVHNFVLHTRKYLLATKYEVTGMEVLALKNLQQTLSHA